MLTLHSFLQSVVLFVKSLAVKVTKQMYRSSSVLLTGMMVVAIIAFSAEGFGGGGKNALAAPIADESQEEEQAEEPEGSGLVTEAKVQFGLLDTDSEGQQLAGALLEANVREKQRQQAAAQTQIETLQKQILKERQEEEARKKAEAAGKTYTVSNLGNISFKWPCPSSSRITSNFGDRESPTEGASSNHKGIDISASTGADIIAAADGEVVISTYSYSAGNYIMLDHGGGVSTVYMHCSKLLVGVGEKVTKGQVIAKVGSTGYSTGSHLHFGIRSGGTYVNPRSYVSP